MFSTSDPAAHWSSLWPDLHAAGVRTEVILHCQLQKYGSLGTAAVEETVEEKPPGYLMYYTKSAPLSPRDF